MWQFKSAKNISQHDNAVAQLTAWGCTLSWAVFGCSQVLLDHRGDCWSVVHSLIGCCAKGGPRRWLQLVCCAYLWSGVQVFRISRAEAWGWCRGMSTRAQAFRKVWCHKFQCFGVQGLGAEHPEGAWSIGSGNKLSRLCTQSRFTRCLTTRTEGPYILES